MWLRPDFQQLLVQSCVATPIALSLLLSVLKTLALFAIYTNTQILQHIYGPRIRKINHLHFRIVFESMVWGFPSQEDTTEVATHLAVAGGTNLGTTLPTLQCLFWSFETCQPRLGWPFLCYELTPGHACVTKP